MSESRDQDNMSPDCSSLQADEIDDDGSSDIILDDDYDDDVSLCDVMSCDDDDERLKEGARDRTMSFRRTNSGDPYRSRRTVHWTTTTNSVNRFRRGRPVQIGSNWIRFRSVVAAQRI